jgi:hypothetical protein
MERFLRCALAATLLTSAAGWRDSSLAGTAATAQPPSENAKISVRVVKYDALKEAVKQCHGKVLVVDVWSTT